MLRVSVAARPLSLLQPTSARQLPHCRRAASSAAPAAAASLEELLQQHRIAPSAPLAADALGRLPSRLAFLQGLGVPDAAVAAVVRRNPSVLSTEPQALSPGLDYLLSLGVADLGGSVRRAPDLLGCSVRRDLGLKVAILQSLGVRDIARYLSRNPRLVSIDVERQMRPAVELLSSIPELEAPPAPSTRPPQRRHSRADTRAVSGGARPSPWPAFATRRPLPPAAAPPPARLPAKTHTRHCGTHLTHT